VKTEVDMGPEKLALPRVRAGRMQLPAVETKGGHMLHVRMWTLRMGKYCPIVLCLALLFTAIEAQSGVWTRKADLPTLRLGVTASVVGGRIYVLGGISGGYVEQTVNEAYDPLTDTWEKRASFSTARCWPASAVVNDTIYCIGGGWPTARQSLEAYDPTTNTWRTRAPMPTARFCAQAVVVKGVVYTIGGFSDLRTCEAYDPATDTWTPKTPRPERGGVLAATAYDGVIYTFGGGSIDSWPASAIVYAYNPQTDSWTSKKDMPTARFGLQVSLVGGKIYAIGGCNTPDVSLATVEVYDPVHDTWEKKPDMPKAFVSSAGAVVNDKIYAIAGSPQGMTGGFEVWEYDPAFHTDIAAGNVSGTWTLAGSPYHIDGEITIPNDSTLTVEPGVDVVFMGHYKFNIQGRILAIGTPTDSIRFTVEDQGVGWHGVRFINTPSANDTSKLLYCSFKYGTANTGSGDDRCGGAMMIRAFDKVVVSNCLFEFNMQSGTSWTPIEAGGVIYVDNASPAISHSTFANNTGTRGSAIVCENSPHATISHSVFVNNAGGYGPVVCDGGGSPSVSGNIISDNFARDGGGGILIGNGSTPRIENNIIFRNQGPPGGGGIVCWTNSNAVLIHNTIAYNYGQLGGGMFCAYNSDPILINNIVYGNSATSGKQLYIEDNTSDPTVVYCDIEGGKVGFGGPGAGANYTGRFENNVDADPLFADTASGNYRLSDSSPCIGAGIDSVQVEGTWYHAPPTCFYDLPRPRPIGLRPDIGACESPLAIPTGVTIFDGTLPIRFDLTQNYPNPFNPSTTIKYELPTSTVVRLSVFDMLGREVSVLVNERKDAGVHEVRFDGSNLASGVYLYRLEAGGFVQSLKLTLLR